MNRIASKPAAAPIWLGFAVNSFIALSFFMVLVFGKGLGLGALLLLLLSPVMLFKFGSPFRPLPVASYEKLIIASFVFYFISCLASFAVEVQEFRDAGDLDLPLRFLIFIPLWWLLRHIPLSAKVIWIALCLGLIGAAIYGSIERLVQLEPLAKGGTNHHILFGSLAMALGLFCLCVPRDLFKGSEYLRWIGFGCGVFASFLSTSRTAWLALIIILPLWIAMQPFTFSRMQKLITASLALLAVIVVINLPDIGVKERLSVAAQDIHAYVFEGDHRGSMGGRFEMWKGSYFLILETPWLGGGLESYTRRIEKLQEDGAINVLIDKNQHAHNDFLNAATNRGLVVGGASMLCLYFFPLYVFWRKRNASQKSEEAQGATSVEGAAAMQRTAITQSAAAAQSGFIFILTYMICGITESLFDRSLSTTLYLFIMVILLSFIRQQEAQADTAINSR